MFDASATPACPKPGMAIFLAACSKGLGHFFPEKFSPGADIGRRWKGGGPNGLAENLIRWTCAINRQFSIGSLRALVRPIRRVNGVDELEVIDTVVIEIKIGCGANALISGRVYDFCLSGLRQGQRPYSGGAGRKCVHAELAMK